MELAPDSLLRGAPPGRQPRVQRVGRFPVEGERRLAVSPKRDEARLPAESEGDMKSRDGDRPALRLTGTPPSGCVQRANNRGGFVDRRIDFGQQHDDHAGRRRNIPFAQQAAPIARPPRTPAGTWYQAAQEANAAPKSRSACTHGGM